MKIWSLPKHENLTTCKKYCGKEEKLLLISPLFHNIFNISLTSRVQLHIYLLHVVNRIISFSPFLQIYVEVRLSRSISESLLEFEITRVDCSCLRYRLFQCYTIIFTLNMPNLFTNLVQKFGQVHFIYRMRCLMSGICKSCRQWSNCVLSWSTDCWVLSVRNLGQVRLLKSPIKQ